MSHLASFNEFPWVGLIPAAGQASRLAPLPCSKELLPIGFQETASGVRPKVISHYLLDLFSNAGIRKLHVVLKKGKWDIPAYYGSGEQLGLSLSYVLTESPHGAPYTLDSAHAFVQQHNVAIGFPDMLYKPAHALKTLKTTLMSSPADVVLGLFPALAPERSDMVAFTPDGTVTRIDVKPAHTTLVFSWALAVWSPVMTDFMHAFLAKHPEPQAEIFLGHVLTGAIQAGLNVTSVCFDDGYFMDAGTPEGLEQALQEAARR